MSWKHMQVIDEQLSLNCLGIDIHTPFFCYIHTSSSLGVESVCTIIFAKKPKKESVTINYQLFLFTSFDTPHSKIVELFCTNLKMTLKS